jgi:iron complex outermembrane recepter protein
MLGTTPERSMQRVFEKGASMRRSGACPPNLSQEDDSMSTSNSIQRAIRFALLSSAASSLSALAPSAQAAEQIAEVVVTGSRIARPEVEASTPVQIISSEVIQEQGSPNIADILAELPAVGTPGLSRSNSNFLTSSNGVSTVNLRNMEDKRTLVLINGRRVVSGVGGTSTVDLNNIPTDLIKSVQVLTGGASAVYGSEAVAGVVNFVLKDDFEGIGLRAQTGLTSENDRKQNLVSLTLGQNIGDKGNVTLNIQYDKDDGLRSRDRKISAEDVPFRSGFVPQGRFDLRDDGGSNWTYSPDNTLQQGFVTAVDGFNRNAERYISVPLERILYTALAHYDITDSTRVFFEGGYSKVDSNSSLEALATDNSDAVLPDGTVSPGLSIENPFIPQPILDQMTALGVNTLPMIKRMKGVFDRSNVNKRDFYRFVVGLDGDVFNDWKWEVYYNQSRTKESTSSETALRDRYYYALDAVADPAGGSPICRDATARASGCVPFNPFGFNSVSPEAAAYITANGIKDTYVATVEQKVAAVNFTGPVFSLPAGDLMVALGAERRWEDSSEIYSPETQAGNTMGNALSNTLGKYDVNEAYLETIVPLVHDQPMAHSLELEAAIRFGDYSTVGNVLSWKGGLSWAPIQDVRFRAVYSKATRAPNIGELYQGANQTFPPGLTDPCNKVTATSTGAADAWCRTIPGIAQQIAAHGSFNYDPNGDTQSIEGFDRGNPTVLEEEAQTWTVGMVLTPSFAPNLSVSIDWFDIKVADAINFVPRQFTIDDCAFSGGTSPLCALITREEVGTPRPRTPGTVFQVDSLPINAADLKTSGIDVAAAYSFEFANNQRLRFTLAYTYLDTLTLRPLAASPVENNKGQLDGDGRLGAGFEHRGNVGITYGIGDLTAVWRANYLGPIKDTLDENGPSLDPDVNDIPSYIYHDVQLRYDFGSDRQYTVFLGGDNIFDKKPPVLGQTAASQITGTETAADTYDAIGRFFYGGVELKF